MMILLYTDFGFEGPYVGQMKAVLARDAANVPVIDLMHDAPAHDPRSAAYMLAALVPEMPEGAVCLAIVDPGVGSDRSPLVMNADGRWFVGPDNGLFEILQRRAKRANQWAIDWRPDQLSRSFHGRDLFAPVAAQLAVGQAPPGTAYSEGWRSAPSRIGVDWPDDHAVVIYIDSFGNAMTGLRANQHDETLSLIIGDECISYAAIFSEVPPGRAFWYRNSCGLVEISVNHGSASTVFGLNIGDGIAFEGR